MTHSLSVNLLSQEFNLDLSVVSSRNSLITIYVNLSYKTSVGKKEVAKGQNMPFLL